MEKNYRQLSLRTRQLMLVSYVAALVVFTLSTLVVPSCNREPNIVVWLLHCLPLLAFLPSILKQSVRAHAWMCFVLLFYFLIAVPVAFACADVVTVAEAVIVVLLFVSAMMYIRWQSRAMKQAGQRDDKPSDAASDKPSETPSDTPSSLDDK